MLLNAKTQAESLKGWTFAQSPWVIELRMLTGVSPNVVRTMRRAGKRSRKTFVGQALRSLEGNLCGHTAQELTSWEDHHKYILSGAGTNAERALVVGWLHDEIHAFVDPQIRDLKDGHSREVLIPVYPGLVWGIDLQPLLPNPPYRLRVNYSALKAAI